MTRLLPFKSLDLTSTYPAPEILARVERLLVAKGSWRGAIRGSRFRITHYTGVRSPAAVGSASVAPSAEGSRVRVTIRLPVNALVVFVATMAMGPWVTVLALQHHAAEPLLWWGLPVFAYVVVMATFQSDARRIERILRDTVA